jgi:D-arginine dehydrogenase
MMFDRYDFIVVGGGIAGASAAFELASFGTTLLLEREQFPGYHSTGRSAAIFLETYGNATVRGLTRGSRAFFEAPPAGFSDVPLVTPRGALFVAEAGTVGALRDHFAAVSRLVDSVRWLEGEQLTALFPALRGYYWVAGAYEPDALDLDVNAIHQGYLRRFKDKGGVLLTDTDIEQGRRTGGLWRLRSATGRFEAPYVVNAAGAWGDVLAQRLGVRPVGLAARQRTAVIVDAHADPAHWPYVGDIAETFYIKPEAGRLLASPCDETEVTPSDVQPEELSVAIIADCLQRVTTLPVERIYRSWAGLRTFAPDRTPVAGFDDDAEGFFWLAGQGGYGIQTAPAMAHVCRSLIIDERLPAHLAAFGVTREALSPARFAAEVPCPA